MGYESSPSKEPDFVFGANKKKLQEDIRLYKPHGEPKKVQFSKSPVRHKSSDKQPKSTDFGSPRRQVFEAKYDKFLANKS